MPAQQPLDPSIIGNAPPPAENIVFLPVQVQELEQHFFNLQTALENAQAELAQAKGKNTVDDVRADLMVPYANKVFYFVAGYCVVVGAMIIASGAQRVTGFQLSDTVLGIIAGSTAVSVIGLIGIVLGGLFRVSGTPKN